MTEPTPKQKYYAKAIADRLEIELPEEETKEAYSEFIDEHKDKYWATVRR